ncbi:unnamed protein product [Rhodiola kirilowii]
MAHIFEPAFESKTQLQRISPKVIKIVDNPDHCNLEVNVKILVKFIKFSHEPESVSVRPYRFHIHSSTYSNMNSLSIKLHDVLVEELNLQLEFERRDTYRSRYLRADFSISKMARMEFSAARIDGCLSTTKCAICFDEFANDVVVVKTLCAHLFHNSCLRYWLMKNKKNGCPMCRAHIQSSNWNIPAMRTQMVVNRKTTCSFCDKSNLASVCSGCVNYRLNEYNIYLKALQNRREPLYQRLAEMLADKAKADEQRNWRVLQNENIARLREQLQRDKQLLSQEKAKVVKMSNEVNVQYGLLESAQKTLEKNRVELLEKFNPNIICAQGLGYMAITSERLHKQSLVMKQICKLFPQRRVTIDGEIKDASNGQYDQICNARLPRGLDPLSVPPDELAASLEYMVQLLNLVVQNLAAPALHNSGFAGSCSRIWQRNSYWDPRPSSRSNEYLLFIPRQSDNSTAVENSWSEKSSSNFGVASMESERKLSPDSTRNTGVNYSAISPLSAEMRKDLQRGISLLKKSVACIAAYCYNSLCLEVPPEASTFEGFAKLLSTLSSSKEVRSVFMASSRSYKQVQQLNKSVWNVDSTISSSSLLESAHTFSQMRNIYDNGLLNSAASYMYPSEMGKNEIGMEGWDLVEHPTFPPPPSQGEDIEHWTRAMIIDATKK